ncbi:sulfate/molybdate ABC transporter ATP-binding protein [Desulfuribacillus alkaliarsenatis]|uniref:ABC-type quaternary amine transporter n=1 Tax=Desulfuribacillus alkaliarsenatis TaxID=766136 RepID=A0A1E5G116_9FIRM|nr:ABC transporter [Desulfuribacillus alkaliarsenatis]
MHVIVRNLNKKFGSFHAAKDVSFDIKKGKLIGLLGPSGGGKTTILRMLAGLEIPCSGDILFHGKSVINSAPQERGIGFVFQNYALFRHMTVFQNIAFGLTIQKKDKKTIANKVNALLELTGLQGLENRYPHQLSGGQRQRVAFARALAPEPQLLLLDEPFAAIDAKVRKELRTWLKEMIQRLGITSIFVTHDQEEAIEIADEIIIINQGRVEQVGTPMQIYKHPRSAFVANFIGESNTIRNIEEWKGFSKFTGLGAAMVRPENVEVLTHEEVVRADTLPRGVVSNVIFKGSNWQVEVNIEGTTVLAYRPLEKKEISVGEEVNVVIHQLHFFDEDKANIVKTSFNKSTHKPLAIYI